GQATDDSPDANARARIKSPLAPARDRAVCGIGGPGEGGAVEARIFVFVGAQPATRQRAQSGFAIEHALEKGIALRGWKIQRVVESSLDSDELLGCGAIGHQLVPRIRISPDCNRAEERRLAMSGFRLDRR
ncbi:MAG: hypothetical protein KDI72_07400, partial [Xanthomonadales bacterium]|nr:hypothetical protein [Xanthomonadales bacterium]